MKGWIFNYSDADSRYSQEVDREQPPVFYTPEGSAVFEVWFWHAQTRRWFAMSCSFNVQLQQQGVIYFDPTRVGWKDRLREVIRGLGGTDADGREGPL